MSPRCCAPFAPGPTSLARRSPADLDDTCVENQTVFYVGLDNSGNMNITKRIVQVEDQNPPTCTFPSLPRPKLAAGESFQSDSVVAFRFDAAQNTLGPVICNDVVERPTDPYPTAEKDVDKPIPADASTWMRRREVANRDVASRSPQEEGSHFDATPSKISKCSTHCHHSSPQHYNLYYSLEYGHEQKMCNVSVSEGILTVMSV